MVGLDASQVEVDLLRFGLFITFTSMGQPIAAL